ncbi:hypothetical protein CL614_06600 [archaeon]|jgi:hypothetical protein|nr:hypothetical protein [archaeon]|tara:strand:- start:186 stop:434 length:249 start_codon:yes stop_codon:yes gene_type:complete
MEKYKKQDKYGWWAAKPIVNTNGKSPAFKVRWCIVCKTAWEIESHGYRKKQRVLHYEDFPTYGLKRKICDDCKENYLKEKNE